MAERTVQLVLHYDGARFAGWQRQPSVRTVQGVIEETLSRLCNTEIRATARAGPMPGCMPAGRRWARRFPPGGRRTSCAGRSTRYCRLTCGSSPPTRWTRRFTPGTARWRAGTVIAWEQTTKPSRRSGHAGNGPFSVPSIARRWRSPRTPFLATTASGRMRSAGRRRSPTITGARSTARVGGSGQAG